MPESGTAAAPLPVIFPVSPPGAALRWSKTEWKVIPLEDRTFIRDYLTRFYEEVPPKDFYRAIFPAGELEKAGDHVKGTTGKYNAIAVELLPAVGKSQNKRDVKRYTVTDDLDTLDTLLESPNFVIMSPISYAGKSRQSKNARFIYAIAIDLDGITEEHYLGDLLHQFKTEHLPLPTFLVWSGTGLHLYYQLEKPVPCFHNIVTQLANMKRDLTRWIWNGFVTEYAEHPQIESLFQGFRLVGGVTKGGNRTRAFAVGDPVSIEYLNGFVSKENRVERYTYKSNMTLEEARRKYPEWYDKRIELKQPRGTWTASRAVFEWWYKKLSREITVGHRYYGVMVLAVYAKKCGIPREELETIAFDLVSTLNSMTTDPGNPFTREDVLSALEMYNDSYITFPIDSISRLTDIYIEKNKRNHRRQSLHLKLARGNKAILKEAGEMRPEGRPSMAGAVRLWRALHPEGTPKECMQDLEISKPTVYKHWNQEEGARK